MPPKTTQKRDKRMASDPKDMSKDDLVKEVYSLRKELTDARTSLKAKQAIIDRMDQAYADKIAVRIVANLQRQLRR